MSDWFKAWLAAWGDKDVEAIAALVTEDVDFEDVGAGHAMKGREAVTKFASKSFKLLPDARFDFVGGAQIGDDYHYEWVMQPMGVRGVSVGKTRDGKMAYNRDYWASKTFQVPTTPPTAS